MYACGDGTTEPPPETPRPTTVTVSPATAELAALGAMVRLVAQVLDQNGQVMAGATVTWASSAATVATVYPSGQVTAVANGAATITAAAGEASGSAAVTVAQVVSAVVVVPDTATVVEGDTLRLAATANDANGHTVAAVEFEWASGDTLVAVVDTSGLATGVVAGQVQVTATTAEVTGRGELTIVAPVPTTISITPDTVELRALGHTALLTAEVRDQAGRTMDGVPVAWSSGDTAIAVVDSSGLVRAVRNGAVTIEATVGEASGGAHVAVSQSAGSMTVSPMADTVSLRDTLRLVAEAYDETGHPVEGAVFAWSTSDTAVATVDSTGLVRGAGEGTATITAIVGDASGTSEITVFHPDRAALVALYNATDGPNWVDNTNWLTDAPLREWYGVVADAKGGVVRLELSGRWDNEARVERHHGLSGVIPAELANLSNLERLDLGINGLSGPIPPELGGLSMLRHLDLASNDLSGSIPPELGGLSMLRHLDIGVNDLSGPIPPELGNLSKLESLWLVRNDFSGPIPPELGRLPKLVSLWLMSNNLSGPIPPELGDLSMLSLLDLASNDLSGKIPPELGGLKKLRGLYLGDNDLSGPIPPELGGLEQLERLGLGGNELGAFPQAFLNLRNLREASAQCSPGGVCVPGTSAFVTWTQRLADANELAFCNAFDQAVLTSFFELVAGDEWAESGGWLGSPALEEWHGVETDSLGRVTALLLSDNGLSGALPGAIADLGQLTRLRIDGNALGGRLPLSLTLLDLREFHYAGTDLCEPSDARFHDWLDGIPAHQGTGVQCPPLTEREALVALHASTGGTGWTDNGGWLTDAPLRHWFGVEVDAQGRVVRLDLNGNELTGAIPAELGGLTKLVWLNLSSNALSGAIPRELGNLLDLRQLSLARNDFAGPIPPELGNLSHLWRLDLSENDLADPIPPELGNLSNLAWLFLNRNELSGTIPPELGGLTNLRLLWLIGNALAGPIPPTFGGLTNLIGLELSHNPGLAGVMPAQLRNLALESLLASGTELCVPREPAFEEWLATIPRRRIAVCGEAPAAYLLQAVQSRPHPVPLVASEDALLRVFVTAAMETTEGIPEVRARFYVNGTERHVADIPGSSTPIPTEIDEGDLANSSNAEIPGWIVQPGLEMVVEIDPDGELDASLGVPRRIPQDGRLAVEVQEMPVLDLTVIPFLWNTDPDSAIIRIVDGMAADPEGHALLKDTHVLLPVGDLDVSAHAPVASTSNSAYDVLPQTEAIRVLEGGRGHYLAMMSGDVTGAAGLAYVGGRSSFSLPYPHFIAHELGTTWAFGTRRAGDRGGIRRSHILTERPAPGGTTSPRTAWSRRRGRTT